MSPQLLHPRYWLLWLGFGLLRLLVLLPYPVLRRLGAALGRLLRPLASSRVRIAERNLELCFPELDAAARAAILDRHFASLGQALFEIPLAWWGADDRLAALGDISGLEHLEAAQAEGKGVLLLSAHFTCLEIGGRILTNQVRLHAMYRQNENPVVEHVMAGGRAASCVDVIPRDAVKQLLRTLRAGDTIWYAPDQNTARRKAVFVRFFGQVASTTPATHKLARLTGARVVPFMSVRKPDGSGYRLILEPALENFPTDDAEADTQRVNDIIERWVREYPDQYLWIHRRFKTRPSRDDPAMY